MLVPSERHDGTSPRGAVLTLALCGAVGFGLGQGAVIVAESWGGTSMGATAFAAIVGMVISALVAGVLARRFMLRPTELKARPSKHTDLGRRENLEAALARHAFDTRVARALEATTTEDDVAEVCAELAEEIAPESSGQLVIIDGPRRGARAASCLPMAVAGRNVGVLQFTSTTGARLHADQLARFEELAAQAAARISFLRAIDHATL